MPRARFEYGFRFVITLVMGVVILIGGIVLSFQGGEFHLIVLGTGVGLAALSFGVSFLNYLAYQSDVKAEQQKDDKIAALQKELDSLKSKNP